NLSPELSLHLGRYVLGLLTFVYYASAAAALRLPLLLFRSESAIAMARVAQSLSYRQSTHEHAATFKLFTTVLRLALPAFTARSFSAILELRHQLNKHGELSAFREHLSNEVILRRVAIDDPASVNDYVERVIMPQVAAIEAAVRGRWRTLRKHVYEQTIADLWKNVLAYS